MKLPWMEGVLNNLLAILSPFVTIVKNIHVRHRFKAEPWLSHFLPTFYPFHLHRWHPQPRLPVIFVVVIILAAIISNRISPSHKAHPPLIPVKKLISIDNRIFTHEWEIPLSNNLISNLHVWFSFEQVRFAHIDLLLHTS